MKGKMAARGMMAFFLVFLLFGLCVKSGLGSEQKTYSLQITLDTSCFPLLNYQSVSPVSASFELKNLGNETFNGTVTLDARTDKHSYSQLQFNVTNLTANATYANSASYSTTDEGNYYFTLDISSSDYSNIKLYQNSNLLSEGSSVHTSATAFLHSYTDFIATVAIIVGAIVTVTVAIYTVKKTRKK